jgi:FixJ family two-component response regulator
MPKELLLSTASALGAIEVLPKPFEIQQLRDAVDRALGVPAA